MSCQALKPRQLDQRGSNKNIYFLRFRSSESIFRSWYRRGGVFLVAIGVQSLGRGDATTKLIYN